ncbi:MAG TPA: hypothetical protein VM901_13785 [Bdellovibrionota bacterium]|nr:hypothetical protein [Bdellovibrionota bacterium]
MKSFFLNRLWLMFVAGLLLGLLIFFPTNQIKEKIFAYVASATGAKLQAESMSFGTGLGLGLGKGGLLGLNFSKLRIQSGTLTVECDEATLTPHLLPFFTGRATIGVRCESERYGALDAKFAARPFWSPATLDADLTFKSFNLAAFGDALQSYPIRGIVVGDLLIDEMPLGGSRTLPPVSWKLAMQKVTLPALTTDFISIPEIPLGTLDTEGSLKQNKLLMKPLTLGNGSSPLRAQLDIDLQLSSQGVPSNGEIKGELSADPAWEASIKDSFDLALFFGEPNESGTRRFRKPVQGGPISLLSPPQPY